MSRQYIERDRKTFRDLAELAGPTPGRARHTVSEIRAKGGVSGAAHEGDSGLIDFATLGNADRAATDRASVTPLASTALADAEDVPTAPKIPLPPPVPSSAAPSSARSVPAAPSSRAIAGAPRAALSTPLAVAAPSLARAVAMRSPVITERTSPIISAQAALMTPAPEPASSGWLARAATVLALGAIAAGTVLAVRTLRTPTTPHAITGAVAAATPGQPAGARVGVPTPTPASDRGIDPMSLPQAGSLTAKPLVMGAAPRHHHHHAHAAAPATNPQAGQAAQTDNDGDDDGEETTTASNAAPASAAADKPAPAAAPAAAAPAAKAAPPPPWLQGALGEAITKAATTGPAAAPASAPAPEPVAAVAGPQTPTPAAAAVAPVGSVPQRPSQGAVTSALSGVLPAARACLGADDDVSRVRVVFGSDGNIQSITVTGFAAGKPQEACIKGAMSKAHVPPFAEASYGANVNVRP